MEDILPAHISGNRWKGIEYLNISEPDNTLSLSGAEILMRVKSSFNQASPIVMELTTKNQEIVVLDVVNNLIAVPPRTVNIPAGVYDYKFYVIYPDGEEIGYNQGKWQILSSTTEFPHSYFVKYYTPGSTEPTTTVPIYSLLSNLTSSYADVKQEQTFISDLTAKWVETAEEMDTMQEELSATWQLAAEDTLDGIIDAGYF